MRAIDTVRGLRPRDVVLLKTRGKGGEKSGGEKEKKQEGKDDEKGKGKRGTISTMLFFLFPSLHEYSSTRICIGFSFEKKWSVAVRLVSGGEEGRWWWKKRRQGIKRKMEKRDIRGGEEAKLSGGQNAKGGIYRRLAFPPVTYYARIRRGGRRGGEGGGSETGGSRGGEGGGGGGGRM